jgi:hypothetical protein
MVVETRTAGYGMRRRRRCRSLSCDHRFTTAEIVAEWPDYAKPTAAMLVTSADVHALAEIVRRMVGLEK